MVNFMLYEFPLKKKKKKKMKEQFPDWAGEHCL